MLCQRAQAVNAIQGVEPRPICAYTGPVNTKPTLGHRHRYPARVAVAVTALLLVLSLQGGLAGCSRPRSTEKVKRMSWEAPARDRTDAREAVLPAVPDEDVLTLVRESPAPDGNGLTQDWVMRTPDSMSQLLFPRWQVTRRGATRYEARFTYTLIDATNQISRLGYAWNVDAALKIVEAPKPFTHQEPTVRSGRTLSQQQRRRIQDEESSLE